MNVHDFLARLSKVKTRGAGRWVACCPAHGDENPSMNVSEAADGRILVCCMSQQCSAEEIASSIGLTLSDLFPEKLSLHHVPPMRRHIPAADILETLTKEMQLVCTIASDMHRQRKISEKDYKRLYLAHDRIANARRLANG